MVTLLTPNVVEEQAIPRSADLQAAKVSELDVDPGKVLLEWKENTGVNNFLVYRIQSATDDPVTHSMDN